MFGWMLVLAAAQAASPVATPDIVVRGERANRALARCLDLGCAVPDDVRLTMALAEAEFGQGRYRDARATLERSLRRNRGTADRYPRQVAALYEASATVSRHLGDMDAYRTAITGQATTIRRHLDRDDLQARMLPLTLGDSWLERGNRQQAMEIYSSAQRNYAAQGESRLAAIAGLRRVAVYVLERDATLAERELGVVSAGASSTDPIVEQMRAVLAARIGAIRGDESGVDRLVAMMRTNPMQSPLLLAAAPMPQSSDMVAAQAQQSFSDPVRGVWSASGSPVRWVDVGYTVRADGSVADVEILRGTLSRGWADPFVAWIASRRYAPLALPDGQPGVYRIERLTRRAKITTPTGSLVRQATGGIGVEIQDLTRLETPAS